MRKALTAMAAVLWTAAAAVAATGDTSFGKKLEEAHALLDAGDVEGALTVYRDLQVEEPESDLLYYNIGRARYIGADTDPAQTPADEAVAGFTAAATAFEKAIHSSNPAVRMNARYNLANTIAQTAKRTAVPGKEL